MLKLMVLLGNTVRAHCSTPQSVGPSGILCSALTLLLHWPTSLAEGDALPETAQWDQHQRQPELHYELVMCDGLLGDRVILHPLPVATSPCSSHSQCSSCPSSPEPSSSSQYHILALCRFSLGAVFLQLSRNLLQEVPYT